MTGSAAVNVLLLLTFLALELGVLLLLGEMVGRALARFSFWRARLPELALLSGYAGFSLLGYAALPFTISAKGIFPAVALAGVALWAYSRTDPDAMPQWIERYFEFRRSRCFLIAAPLLALFCALVVGYRMPWLVHLTIAGKMVSGTPIWDDARTIGMPVALASYGFPLHNPLAAELRLIYPLGAFIYPAAMLAWVPSMPLPVILADSGAQTIWYCVMLLFLAGTLLGSNQARALLLVAGTVSVSMNLWLLDPKPGTAWLEKFYGYYRINGLATTIGWTPFLGMLWIPNHVLAFGSILLAAFWLVKDPAPRYVGLPLLFGAFCGVTSLDMTGMGLAATGIIFLARIASDWRAAWRSPVLRCTLAIAATAFLLLAWINLPTLRGAVDSPFDPPFPLNTYLYFNIGLLGSHTGPYLLMLAAGCVLLRGLGFSKMWLAVIATGYAFALIFEYHSIWVWRFSFASHLLLGLAAAWQLERFPVRWRRVMLAVWVVLMLPGLAQLEFDFRAGGRWAAWTTPDRAAAVEWVVEHTPLQSRVAEYRVKEASLATDPNFLRAGNRGGQRAYDRIYPVIGFRDYVDRMKDLSGALASNDFVLVPKEAAPLKDVLLNCSPPRYANAETSVFEINAACRTQLLEPGLYGRTQRAQRQLNADSVLAGGQKPEDVPTPALADYVSFHPDKVMLIRQRMDKLWEKGKFDEALAALESIRAEQPDLAEINYCYAFTLHVSGKDPARAVEFYTRALNKGYDEFWVRYNRAGAFLLLKKPLQARPDLEAARRLNPKHPGVQLLFDQLSHK